ncbi:MAG: trans-sulfuration enzyme family protein [bacterium]
MPHKLETQLIHAGEPSPRAEGAVAMPIYQTAMFLYAGEQSYHDLKYIRLNNTPNHVALHRKFAALEGGEAALVTASGMAAITTALLTVLGEGGHLLAQDCLYGGTHDFLTKDFAGFGLSYSFLDANAPATWEKSLRPNTKAVYVEAMTNPTLQVADLEAAVIFARAHGLIFLIDNTFASPVNFNPIAHGFDLVLHSCTKYMNGHSDLVAGCVIGRADLIEKITHKLNHLGGSLDPHACYLLHRGVKTLALRMRYQNESALALARFLESHSSVENVNYPGLESHPQHGRAKKLFRGFSGMMSFELKGGVEEAERFISRVRIPLVAPSLGVVETLITRPSKTSHAGMSQEDRRRLGISDKLIRLSVGVEATEDLMEDFKQALG